MSTLLAELFERYPVLQILSQPLVQAADILEASCRKGGMILTCGNGGSAADADHFVAELMKGFLHPRPIKGKLVQALGDLAPRLQIPFVALSLGGQSALSSAIANDLGADLVFAQQLLGYGRTGDVLVAFSTSGNSENVLNAAKVARALEMKVIGLTGRSGGALASLCDVALCAPEDSTPLVQEVHLPIYHYLAAELESRFFSA